MTASPSSTPLRHWRLQFSLRLALLALTAFAIAFPLWYRWPYEEVEILPSPFKITPKAPESSRVTTWQRQWGGGKLKHGPERSLLGGQTTATITYRHGQRHGPADWHTISARPSGKTLTLVVSDKPTTTGQYVDDEKEGIWITTSETSKVSVTWRLGKLEGPYDIESSNGPKMQLLFAAGRLTHFNGQPARNRLFDLLESGELDPVSSTGPYAPVAVELRNPTTIDFVETPLVDVVVFLQETHNLPMFLDSARVPDPQLPITADFKGIDLCSALTLLTAPHDLGCDFRYGMLWITSAKDAQDWHDPTGVAQIEPPQSSALARAWNEPATLSAINQPLAPVLATIAQPLAIEIDTSQIAPTADNPSAFAITANAKSLPFRHILGFALYQSNCRCKLEGDKLIILPPAPGP